MRQRRNGSHGAGVEAEAMTLDDIASAAEGIAGTSYEGCPELLRVDITRLVLRAIGDERESMEWPMRLAVEALQSITDAGLLKQYHTPLCVEPEFADPDQCIGCVGRAALAALTAALPAHSSA